MNAVQPIAEILPTVIAHLHERTRMEPAVITPENRPVDPDRAEHEINPDGWHTSVGVAASNCPFCNEVASGGNVRSGEGGSQR